MGEWATLTASDGFRLVAYRSDPEGAPKGAVVVIQEIFGVNNVSERQLERALRSRGVTGPEIRR